MANGCVLLYEAIMVLAMVMAMLAVGRRVVVVIGFVDLSGDACSRYRGVQRWVNCA